MIPPALAFPPTKTLEDIVPEQRAKFRALVDYAAAQGWQPKIRGAGRTCAMQQQYLAEGATTASLCRSAHIIGHAVDLDLTPNDCATHTKLGEWWEQTFKGTWGGRWTHLFPGCGDMGHYHWLPDQAGAVSESVCPAGVDLAQCEQIRADYLTKAFGWKPPSRTSPWTWAFGAVGVAVVAVVVARRSR